MKYQVGDLLVKAKGKISIQYVTHVRPMYATDTNVITLCDMSDKTERTYHDTQIDSWLYYKHYPVKV